MSIITRISTIMAFLWLALPLSAQQDDIRMIYHEAEENYAIGRIDQARDLLKNHLSEFDGSLLESAYRLMSLCYLANDDEDEAEYYASLLLRESPYYSVTPQDPKRFADIIAQIKAGLSATITTASSQAENLNEVPVPTTLITEEMIRLSGARNLQEVLAAYVPGMNIVDCNDDINIAMRGVYSNGQENILIMLNGHRLNSYCTNIASPDFSIGLEKLRQIEVLRGPASSLYGGVALTAVVNLITKQGVDVDGVMVKAGIGNHGQKRADLIFGKHYFDLDLLVWGSLYGSNGEDFEQDYDYFYEALKRPGKVTVGRIGTKPSYDFGVQLKWRDLLFMYNTHFSQVISPFSMGYIHLPYNIDRYKTYNGIKPSIATQSHHADLSYQRQLGNWFLKGTLRYDNSDVTHYKVISDSVIHGLTSVLGLKSEGKYQILDSLPGISRYINGLEQTFGIQLKGDYNYFKNQDHKGTLSFGAEFIHFQLEDARYLLGYNFNAALEPQELGDFGKGIENSYDTFLQLKHQWRSLIINAGIRYDGKHRYDKSNINEVSPRLALIWSRPKWNLRLSYSKSFIDAPYFYRKSNTQVAFFKQVPDTIKLSKETLHSFQLTFGGTQWVRGLNFEFNFFFNHARDLIFQSIIEHMNAGNIDTYGLEFMANYEHRGFTAHFSSCWQKISKSEVYGRNFSEAFNIPILTSNLILGWRPIPQLLLHSHLTFEGKSTTYQINVFGQALDNIIREMLDKAIAQKDQESIDYYTNLLNQTERHEIDTQENSPRFLVNLGAEYTLGRVKFALNVNNLFDKYFERSGMGSGRAPQKGRWFMFTTAIRL